MICDLNAQSVSLTQVTFGFKQVLKKEWKPVQNPSSTFKIGRAIEAILEEIGLKEEYMLQQASWQLKP